MRPLDPRPVPRRDPEAGFTLIEVLVALSIFALAAMALLNAAGENTRTAARVADRVYAAVVAENRAVELLIDPAPQAIADAEGEEALGGRIWRWTRRVSPTPDAGLIRIDLSVAREGGGRPAAELTVFRGRS